MHIRKEIKNEKEIRITWQQKEKLCKSDTSTDNCNTSKNNNKSPIMDKLFTEWC